MVSSFIFPSADTASFVCEEVADGYKGTYDITVHEVESCAYDMLFNKRSRFFVMVEGSLQYGAKEMFAIGRGWEGFTMTKAECLTLAAELKAKIERHNELRTKEDAALLEGSPRAALYQQQRKGYEQYFSKVWGLKI
jgi:hypothetical protein